jgi:hypothetical protein
MTEPGDIFRHYLETGETPQSIARAKEARRPINRIKTAVFNWVTVGVLLALSFVARAVGVILGARGH